MFKLLMAAAIIGYLGFTFGPPKYVAYAEQQRIIKTVHGEYQAYLAWRINRWLPIEPFAELVWYSPAANSEQSLTVAELQQAQASFAIPRPWFSTYLWWLLPPLFWASYKLIGLGLSRWRIKRNHQRHFAIAVRRNTVIAYEAFLQQTENAPLKPVRLRRKAEQARHDLYQKYIHALVRETHSADERVLNTVIAKFLAFNQQQKQRVLPLKLQLESGFITRLKGQEQHFAVFEDYFSQRINQAAKKWLGETYSLGLPSMTEWYRNWDERARNCAKAVKVAGSWQPLAELRKRFASFTDDALLHNFGKSVATDVRAKLVNYADLYLVYSVYRYLPVDKQLVEFQQNYKKMIGKRIAQAFSAYFPAETKPNGVRPELFLSPTYRQDSHMGKLVIELVFENKILTDGMPVVTSRLYFCETDEQRQPLLALEKKLATTATKEGS